MRKWLSVLFVFCSAILMAQGPIGGALPEGQGQEGEVDEHLKTTDIKVIPKMHVWTLNNEFSTNVEAKLDTATINFHTFNPMLKQSISNTFTGHLGAPYESNIFFKRTQESQFYFLQSFDSYRLSQDEVKYYNTTTPYAHLFYEQSTQAPKSLQKSFKAFFTQNIDSITNVGFDFNVFTSPSQYMKQEATHKFLNVFMSRNSLRYHGYLNVINSTDEVLENGGLQSDSLDRFGTYSFLGYKFRDYPSNFPVAFTYGLENTTKSLSLFTSHEYFMGEIPFLAKDTSRVDSIYQEFKPRYSIQYSAEYENNSRMLYENSVEDDYFDTTYMNLSNHTDSAFQTRFSHILQVKALEDTTKKFTFGKRVYIQNENVIAKHGLPNGQRTYRYSNVYIGGEIYRSESVLGKWNAGLRFALLGRNLGDATISGSWQKNLSIGKDTAFFKAQGWYKDVSPNIFQDHYFSNHFKWENNFNKQHEVVLKGQLNYPRFNLSTGADYALFSNYLYNNALALPDQYNGEFSVISAWVNKDFKVGRFVWSNKAVWQELSTDVVLRLPAWSFYTSLYYSHYLFKVMKIQLGVEAYYNTKFKANRYEPTTTRFYLQDEYKTGGYPLVSFFANAKLKRTSAFAMLYHANGNLDFGEYFVSPNYPLGQMVFRFGFFWTFYD